jgi:S-DNA-T family DNA segregation ATPase FtsK/SpoIIIE
MGKTRWLYALLYALLTMPSTAPLPFQLAIVDPKAVDMLKFRHLPHVAAYADDAERAHEVTGWLAEELSRRQQLFTQHSATNLAQYNRRATEPLPLVVAVVDEFADIAITQGLNSPFYRELMRLVAKGAAFGIVLVMATQNPKAEVVNTLIRDNCSVRLAFRCESPYQSKAIIGRVGADELPAVRGRMVARVYSEYHTLQGYWVDDAEVEHAIERWTPRKPPPVLDELQLKLIEYSLEQLGGAFVIDKLARAFMGQVGRDKLLVLAQGWEAKGWLSPCKRGGAARPRQVTPTLLALYREVRQGEQTSA